MRECVTDRLREDLLEGVLVARAGVAEDELGLVLQQRAVVLQLRLGWVGVSRVHVGEENE